MGLTEKEIKTLVTILKKLDPGFFPLTVFEQFARLNRLVTLDIVPIRTIGSKIQIGILKRDLEDLWWPGMWLLAGTILRSTDTEETAIKRLKDSELDLKSSNKPIFKGVCMHDSIRGSELTLIYTVENCVFRKNSEITWFPINALPNGFVKSEKEVVKKMVKILVNKKF